MLRLHEFEPHLAEKKWLHEIGKRGGFCVQLDDRGKVTTIVLSNAYGEQIRFLENFEHLIDVSFQFIDCTQVFDETKFQTLVLNTRLQALKFVSIKILKSEIIALRAVPKLTWLRFNNCKLDRDSIAEIKDLNSLRHLSILEFNNYSPDTFENLASLKTLESLELNEVMISDEVSREILSRRLKCTVTFRTKI